MTGEMMISPAAWNNAIRSVRDEAATSSLLTACERYEVNNALDGLGYAKCSKRDLGDPLSSAKAEILNLLEEQNPSEPIQRWIEKFRDDLGKPVFGLETR